MLVVAFSAVRVTGFVAFAENFVDLGLSLGFARDFHRVGFGFDPHLAMLGQLHRLDGPENAPFKNGLDSLRLITSSGILPSPPHSSLMPMSLYPFHPDSDHRISTLLAARRTWRNVP